MVETVEILDGRLGKRSVERVRYVIKNLLHLSHCEIWSHFTRILYFHSPSARDNTVVTREISRNLLADPCNWRASEVSETLSGLFNRELRIYIYYM